MNMDQVIGDIVQFVFVGGGLLWLLLSRAELAASRQRVEECRNKIRRLKAIILELEKDLPKPDAGEGYYFLKEGYFLGEGDQRSFARRGQGPWKDIRPNMYGEQIMAEDGDDDFQYRTPG